MKRINVLQLTFCSLMLLSAAAAAQKSSIYSWTDENGIQHFSDTAPSDTNTNAEELTIAPPPESPGTSDDTMDEDSLNNEFIPENDAGAAEDMSYADQQRQAIQEKHVENEKVKAERNRSCLEARDQLAQIEPNRRVFYTDESGDTVRMDDEERVRLVAEAKSRISEYCD